MAMFMTTMSIRLWHRPIGPVEDKNLLIDPKNNAIEANDQEVVPKRRAEIGKGIDIQITTNIAIETTNIGLKESIELKGKGIEDIDILRHPNGALIRRVIDTDIE